MKNLFSLLAIAAFALITWSCSSNTPTGVAKQSIEAIEKGDYEGYVDLLYIKNDKNKEETKQQLVALMKEKGAKTVEQKQGIKSCTVEEETLSDDGEKATVKMKVLYGNGKEETEDFSLRKDEDGNWKIDIGK